MNTEDKYCVIAEQVSHHPPITALHVESEKWVFWEEYKLEVKFRGQVGNGNGVLEWDFGSIGMGCSCMPSILRISQGCSVRTSNQPIKSVLF